MEKNVCSSFFFKLLGYISMNSIANFFSMVLLTFLRKKTRIFLGNIDCSIERTMKCLKYWLNPWITLIVLILVIFCYLLLMWIWATITVCDVFWIWIKLRKCALKAPILLKQLIRENGSPLEVASQWKSSLLEITIELAWI